MIDRTHDLPVARQAQLVGIRRGTVYYRPAPMGDADLRLMRRLDELHLELPFAGSRMRRDLIRREGCAVGRRYVATLMRKMGIEALYRKPNTSRKHPSRLLKYEIWWKNGALSMVLDPFGGTNKSTGARSVRSNFSTGGTPSPISTAC